MLVRLLALLGAAFLLANPSIIAAAQELAPAAELRAATQALLDAVGTGDRTVWNRYLDDDIVHVDENGERRAKRELISQIAPLPEGLIGSITISTFEAHFWDDLAVVTHEDQESLSYHGQHLGARFRSVDTWRRTPAGWRLVGMHVAAVLRDPPHIALSRRELCTYNGRYALTATIYVDVRCEGQRLRVEREGRPADLYDAEVRDVFFLAGRPRTRRIFERGAHGDITGFVDRREGEDIFWRRVQ